MFNKIKQHLNNQNLRDKFVAEQISKLPQNTNILDAGCGGQQYRHLCKQLEYFGQDFGKYEKDITDGFTSKLGGEAGYSYGELSYVGDIWNIDAKDQSFDAILCTEVFEHIPYPIETLREFSRLIRPNGKLILTLPSNCLRHMDPYYYYSGFSNRFLEKFLADNGFTIELIEPVGDYYLWIAVELARSIRRSGILAAIFLLPAFVWFYLKRPTAESVNTLCMGYHVVAKKQLLK